MKTVFKVGMKVYDQVFFPDTYGKIVEIYNKNDKIQLEVKFFSKYRLEPLCMQSSFFYDEKGNMTSAWDRTCETPTLSTKPYEVELKGFEQKAPVPTYEEAQQWMIDQKGKTSFIGSPNEIDKNFINYSYYEAFEALKKLVILRDYYNDGWQPDWKDEEKKFSIEIYEGEFDTFESIECQRVFSFKTEEIRDKFLEEQRELLEIAKPLL